MSALVVAVDTENRPACSRPKMAAWVVGKPFPQPEFINTSWFGSDFGDGVNFSALVVHRPAYREIPAHRPGRAAKAKGCREWSAMLVVKDGVIVSLK